MDERESSTDLSYHKLIMSSAGTQLLEDWQRFVAARKALVGSTESPAETRRVIDEYIAAFECINDRYDVKWRDDGSAVINDTIILTF